MVDAALFPAIEQALSELRYGSVQLVVHDGHVVRIERIERIRLTDTFGSHTTEAGRPTPTTEGRHGERMA